MLKESFTFTCTVTEAAGLSDKVDFYRKGYNGVFGALYQNAAVCAKFPPETGYSVSCGSGTDDSSSSIKQYTLKIHRAAVRDSTDWWCQLNTARTRSQNVSLAVYSE